MPEKSSILFVATQFGSFNLIYPILQASLGRYAVGYIGVRDIETKGLNYHKVVREDEEIDYGVVDDFDLILTGTSPTSDIEYNMWRHARARDKSSICILDMTKLCRDRFQKNGEIFLPDMVFVIDEDAKEAVSHMGMLPENIVVTGSPHLEAVDLFRLTDKEKEQVRGDLQLGRKRLITFCTEYIAASGERDLYGYDEFDIVRVLADYIVKRGVDHIRLRIRLHPRDDRKIYEEFFRNIDCDLDFEIAENEKGYRFLQASDAVVGMTSTILTEAHMLGLHVISFQPAGREMEIHAHNSLIESVLVTTAEALHERLDEVLKKPRSEAGPPLLGNSNESLRKIMKIIDDRLPAPSPGERYS